MIHTDIASRISGRQSVLLITLAGTALIQIHDSINDFFKMSTGEQK